MGKSDIPVNLRTPYSNSKASSPVPGVVNWDSAGLGGLKDCFIYSGIFCQFQKGERMVKWGKSVKIGSIRRCIFSLPAQAQQTIQSGLKI